MINLIEIKDRRIFFITNEKQFSEFFKANEKHQIKNCVLLIDNNFITDTIFCEETFKYETITNKFGKFIDVVVQQSRKFKISVILFCNSKQEVDKRITYSTERFIKIDDANNLMIYQNLRTGKTKYIVGEL